MTLMKKNGVSLAIKICHTIRKMLPNNILLYILYRVCIKNTHSNNINNVRKKAKFHLLLLIRIRLNIVIPIKFQLGTI